MFIGYIDGNQDMYRDFQNMGYTLIFKPTLPNQSGEVKGNCDAELVLQAMVDINDYDKAELRKMYYSFPGYRDKIKRQGIIAIEL